MLYACIIITYRVPSRSESGGHVSCFLLLSVCVYRRTGSESDDELFCVILCDVDVILLLYVRV